MTSLFRHIGAVASALFCASILAGCSGTTDPVLETAQTPMMLGDSAADRVVSLQTRTMLAGLACGAQWNDPQAFSRYASFTVRNAEIIRHSQRELAERMGGLSEFDQMHTRISNGESMRMLNMGDAAYCSEMRMPFYTAVSLEPDELTRRSVVAEIKSN
ncbi:hypothetical protein N825_17305 [Skermanella stibiiresistens SB22]|uniref:Uncharacterized protein n=1 Tax=Skermanella stibiiresistens SB22 TaxID=1385369 RepID=W9GV18_9PROT|nr:hypothetical protein [Skermanella stibiiresistens]EWY37619.1 hypothetical protein N825_17305 [Skermanella stibiiresistens SB22]